MCVYIYIYRRNVVETLWTCTNTCVVVLLHSFVVTSQISPINFIIHDPYIIMLFSGCCGQH